MLIGNPLNESSLALPLLEFAHLVGIACGVGTAALVNLCLLGVGVTKNSPAELWRSTKPFTLSGLLLAVFCGLLLFSIDPEAYYSNPVFQFKIASLLAAMGFYYTMVRRAAVRDRKAPLAAIISLALYALVLLNGILIGYY